MERSSRPRRQRQQQEVAEQPQPPAPSAGAGASLPLGQQSRHRATEAARPARPARNDIEHILARQITGKLIISPKRGSEPQAARRSITAQAGPARSEVGNIQGQQLLTSSTRPSQPKASHRPDTLSTFSGRSITFSFRTTILLTPAEETDPRGQDYTYTVGLPTETTWGLGPLSTTSTRGKGEQNLFP